MADGCLFCGIVAGDVDARIVARADGVVAFEDVSPQAPVHVLVVPEDHMSSLEEAGDEDEPILGRLLLTAAGIARQRGIADSGYRVAMNCNEEGGQTVYHAHLHLIGGEPLGGRLRG